MSLVVLLPKPSTVEYNPQLTGIPGEVEIYQDSRQKKPKVDKVVLAPSSTKVIKVIVGNARCPMVESYLRSLGAGSYYVKLASKIAFQESSCNPLAVNPSNGITGIFQYTYATFYDHSCDRWGNYKNWKAQTRCAWQDLRRGYLSQWEVTHYW